MKKIIIISIISLFLIISTSVYILFMKTNISYQTPALDYIKELDKDQPYVYVGQTNEGCKMLIGCIVIVHLQSKTTQKLINVEFRDGKLVPMALIKEDNLVTK